MPALFFTFTCQLRTSGGSDFHKFQSPKYSNFGRNLLLNFLRFSLIKVPKCALHIATPPRALVVDNSASIAFAFINCNLLPRSIQKCKLTSNREIRLWQLTIRQCIPDKHKETPPGLITSVFTSVQIRSIWVWCWVIFKTWR